MTKENFLNLKVGDQIRYASTNWVYFVVTGRDEYDRNKVFIAQRDISFGDIQTTTTDECEDWVKVK